MKVNITRGKNSYDIKGACIDACFNILGPVMTNCFVLTDGESTIVVDPSADADKIIAMLQGKKLDAIFVTHHHHDHVGALKELKDKTGAKVYASEIDAPIIENQTPGDAYISADSCPVDVKLRDKDKVRVGSMVWKVISTPGHTPGSICFFLDSEQTNHPEKPHLLVSGDTLFCGTIGRTDFEGGSLKDMRASLKKLSQLPGDTLVLPGHNSLTTIQDEQRRVFAYYC
ncbi:MAG: MBL fold metallo-hydrolase [Anaerotardibacter sp.]